MGIVQDTLCGVRKFTLQDCFVEWAQVQNFFSVGAQLGRHSSNTSHPQTKAPLVRQTDSEHDHSKGYQHLLQPFQRQTKSEPYLQRWDVYQQQQNTLQHC